MPATEPLPTTSSTPNFTWTGLVRAAWNLFLVMFLVVTLAGFLGNVSRHAELTSHFRAQYTVVALLLIAICLVARQWRLAWLPIAALAVNLYFLAPYWFAAAPTWPAAGKPHRAMLLNLFVDNPEHEKVRQLVREQQPDFIVFTELTPAWLTALEPLHEAYPHRSWPSAEEMSEHLQLGVFSRHPLRNLRREKLTTRSRPGVSAEVMLEPEPLCLLAIHPYPPMSEDRFQERNLVLRAVAAAATQRSADPIMLLGDLNASSFSPIFSELVGLSGLRDSQLDFGLQRSWPTDHYLLRIPIDHCLTSPRVVVQQRWLGPHVGSDHFPVLVDFSIRPAE